MWVFIPLTNCAAGLIMQHHKPVCVLFFGSKTQTLHPDYEKIVLFLPVSQTCLTARQPCIRNEVLVNTWLTACGLWSGSGFFLQLLDLFVHWVRSARETFLSYYTIILLSSLKCVNISNLFKWWSVLHAAHTLRSLAQGKISPYMFFCTWLKSQMQAKTALCWTFDWKADVRWWGKHDSANSLFSGVNWSCSLVFLQRHHEPDPHTKPPSVLSSKISTSSSYSPRNVI